MIKRLLRIAVALSLFVTVSTAGFVPKASAATNEPLIFTCDHTTLTLWSPDTFCVIVLQSLLNDARKMYVASPYMDWPKLTLDGKLGPATQRAVKAYQLANKLQGDVITVDGIAGPQTWRFMIADCFFYWPPQGLWSKYCQSTNMSTSSGATQQIDAPSSQTDTARAE